LLRRACELLAEVIDGPRIVRPAERERPRPAAEDAERNVVGQMARGPPGEARQDRFLLAWYAALRIRKGIRDPRLGRCVVIRLGELLLERPRGQLAGLACIQPAIRLACVGVNGGSGDDVAAIALPVHAKPTRLAARDGPTGM